MSPETVEKGKAAGWPPTARKNVDLARSYTPSTTTSRGKLMGQAADVALLLTLYPLTVAERLAFGLLLEHRLRRAYAGGRR